MKKALTESNQQIEASGVWPNIIGNMTGTGCYGLMRLFAMYTVGMFGVKRMIHTRKSTSYLDTTSVCFGAVLLLVVQGLLLRSMA